MNEITYGIHWLSVVIEGTKTDGFMLYELFFKNLFGDLASFGHGGRGFEEIWMSLFGFKLYDMPYQGAVEYFHFEIPGSACEFIDWKIFQGFDDVLRHNYADRYHYTRLDFAFDHVPFTPQDVEDAISNEQVRSLAKRESMTVNKTPFGQRDDGEVGTYTVNFGSRQSERMIRVYNRRGFTRLEIEMKQKRADLVAKGILAASDISEWYSIAVSHLRDFVDFDTPWWNEFVGSVGRAHAKVTTPKEVTLEIMANWLERQVAVPLSIINDVRRDGYIERLLTLGRKKRMETNKYNILYKNLDSQWSEIKKKKELKEEGEDE